MITYESQNTVVVILRVLGLFKKNWFMKLLEDLKFWKWCIITSQFEASELKWVNPVLNIIGFNSLRLGGLHIHSQNKVIENNEKEITDDKWRPPNLSELNPMIFNMGLTYLGSKASKWHKKFNIYAYECVFLSPSKMTLL